MFSLLRVLSIAIAWSLSTTSAVACPFCDSVTAERVRAGIFDFDFLYHVAATLAPFPILIGLVAFIHFSGMPASSKQTSGSKRNFPAAPSDDSEPKL